MKVIKKRIVEQEFQQLHEVGTSFFRLCHKWLLKGDHILILNFIIFTLIYNFTILK